MRVNVVSGRTRVDDDDVAAAWSLAGQLDLGAGVGAGRDGDLEALAVDVDEAGRAVERLGEGELGGRLVAGGRRGSRRRVADGPAVDAHPGEDVLEGHAPGRAGAAAGRLAGRAAPAAPVMSSPKNIRKKSENSPASPVVRNS